MRIAHTEDGEVDVGRTPLQQPRVFRETGEKVAELVLVEGEDQENRSSDQRKQRQLAPLLFAQQHDEINQTEKQVGDARDAGNSRQQESRRVMPPQVSEHGEKTKNRNGASVAPTLW